MVHLPLALWTHVWISLHANQTLHPEQGGLTDTPCHWNTVFSCLFPAQWLFFFYGWRLLQTQNTDCRKNPSRDKNPFDLATLAELHLCNGRSLATGTKKMWRIIFGSQPQDYVWFVISAAVALQRGQPDVASTRWFYKCGIYICEYVVTAAYLSAVICRRRPLLCTLGSPWMSDPSWNTHCATVNLEILPCCHLFSMFLHLWPEPSAHLQPNGPF